MIKVIYVQRIFVNYRKGIYDLLSKKIKLYLVHGNSKSDIKTISTNYSVEVNELATNGKNPLIFLNTFNVLFKLKPEVVIHEFSIRILSMPLMYLFCRIKKIKFILYSHGYNRRKGFLPESRLLDKYRLWLLQLADAVILYGQYDKQLLSEYVQSEKIFVAQNTLDTPYLNEIASRLAIVSQKNIKEKLNFNAKFNIVFIGRLLVDKNVDMIIKAISIMIKEYHLDVFLHIVGSGEMDTSLRNMVKEYRLESSVKFYGAIHDDNISGEILYASDIMVMPGYLGLSVNHAFCFNCPVLSFEQQENGPFHSPEVEYVIDGKTGFLLKEHTEFAIALTLKDYFTDKHLQNEFKVNIRNMVKNVFPIEKMVDGIVDAVNYVTR